MLAMDHSGSMQATDVAPSRLEATVAAGERFLEEVPDRVRVGGVVFDHRAEAVQTPTRDREALRLALREKMRPSGGTATGDALATSLAMLQARARPGRQAAAGRGRAALRRQVHPRPRPAPGRRPGARDGRARLHRRARHGRRHAPGRRARAARHRGAARDRRALRRAARSPPRRRARCARSTSGSARRSRPSARTARSPRCSPAARSCCSSGGSGLSLLWFRRLV